MKRLLIIITCIFIFISLCACQKQVSINSKGVSFTTPLNGLALEITMKIPEDWENYINGAKYNDRRILEFHGAIEVTKDIAHNMVENFIKEDGYSDIKMQDLNISNLNIIKWNCRLIPLYAEIYGVEQIMASNYFIYSDEVGVRVTYIPTSEDKLEEESKLFESLLDHIEFEYLYSYRKLIKADGVVYTDTGKIWEDDGNARSLDGSITSSVDENNIPTINDQSNFGVGYGYRFGMTKSTIEVLIDDYWYEFITEDPIDSSVGENIQSDVIRTHSSGSQLIAKYDANYSRLDRMDSIYLLKDNEEIYLQDVNMYINYDIGFFKNGDVYIYGGYVFNIYIDGILDYSMQDHISFNDNYVCSVHRTEDKFYIVYAPNLNIELDGIIVKNSTYKLALIDRDGNILNEIDTDINLRVSDSGFIPMDLSVSDNVIKLKLENSKFYETIEIKVNAQTFEMIE